MNPLPLPASFSCSPNCGSTNVPSATMRTTAPRTPSSELTAPGVAVSPLSSPSDWQAARMRASAAKAATARTVAVTLTVSPIRPAPTHDTPIRGYDLAASSASGAGEQPSTACGRSGCRLSNRRMAGRRRRALTKRRDAGRARRAEIVHAARPGGSGPAGRPPGTRELAVRGELPVVEQKRRGASTRDGRHRACVCDQTTPATPTSHAICHGATGVGRMPRLTQPVQVRGPARLTDQTLGRCDSPPDRERSQQRDSSRTVARAAIHRLGDRDRSMRDARQGSFAATARRLTPPPGSRRGCLAECPSGSSRSRNRVGRPGRRSPSSRRPRDDRKSADRDRSCCPPSAT